MIIFTPNSVIKSTEVNSNFDTVKTFASGFNVYRAARGTNVTVATGASFAVADVTGVSVTFTPAVDCQAIILADGLFDKGSTNDQFNMLVRENNTNDVAYGWGELGVTVQYCKRTSHGQRSLTAGTTYTYKMCIQRGNASTNVICRADGAGTGITVITIPTNVSL